eukprot:UN05503
MLNFLLYKTVIFIFKSTNEPAIFHFLLRQCNK